MSLLNQYLNPSKEEYNEETQADIQEEWINLPETSVPEIAEGLQTEAVLTELGDQVEASDSVFGLEAYAWAFQTISRLKGFEPQAYPSNEGYAKKQDRRKDLVQAIRAHTATLTAGINIAVEAYADQFGQTLDHLIQNISRSAEEINHSVSNIGNQPKKKVNLDQSRFWALVHVNGKPVKDLNRAINEDTRALTELLKTAQAAASALQSSGAEADTENVFNQAKPQYLLFNTTVLSEGGRLKFEKVPVDGAKAKSTMGDRVKAAAMTALFGGLITAAVIGTAGTGAIIGAVAGAAGARKAGSTADAKREINQMKQFLHGIYEARTLMREITTIARQLSSILDKEEEDAAELKRKATAVMEVVTGVARHVAEVMYAGAVMAKKLADSTDVVREE